MSRLSTGTRAILLLGLAAVLLLAGAGQAPMERAEIYFVDGARAMLERADFLVPYYRGEPFFDKPPLTYWLIAAAFEAFGFTLEAARLVPTLAALGTLLATLWLGALLLDARTGMLAAMLLATTPAFLSFGRIAMSDMPLTFFSTLALALGAALLARPAPRPASGTAMALAATLGCGFLAKGPVAVLLPGLGLGVLAWRFRQRTRSLQPGVLLAAAGVFLLVTLPWFLLVQRRLGWAPLEYFFLHENLERFVGETYDSGRSPFYYLGVYAAEGLPWSPFLLPALIRLARGQAEGRQATLLLTAWVGLMLLPLSLSHGKIDYYLLPAFPPLSLLVALFLRSAWTRSERALARAVLLCAALALAAAPLLASELPGDWLPPAPARAFAQAAALILATALVFGALRLRPARAVGLLAGAAAGAFLLTAVLYLPALRKAQPNGEIVRDVVRERSFRPDARLVFCADPTRVARDLLFEARLASIERCDLWAPAASSFPFLLLLDADQRETLRIATRYVGEYRYLPATVTTLARFLDGVEPERLVLLANYETTHPEADRRARKDRKRRVREKQRERLQRTEGPAVP